MFSSSQVWSHHGHECHVLCLDASTAACVAESPLKTFALGTRKRSAGSIWQLVPPLRYGYTSRLARWLKENAGQYDAIILNGLWNYTSFGSWLVLRNLKVPYYVCPHGMLDPWLRETDPTGHILRRLFWLLFERRVVRDARGVFFASEEEKRLAKECFFRDDGRMFVVGYGTLAASGNERLQKAAFLLKFPQMRDRRFILFLSRIHPKKGLDLLIRAFARCADNYPDFDLVIAGPDQVGLKGSLTSIAAELGVEKRIHWTDMLMGDEKLGALQSAEFFVLPSHQENFGIAVVEALALAVPVLITSKVNIWPEVVSYNAGRVVPDDLDGIAEGLFEMCRFSPSQRYTLARNARRCFLERFDLEKNAVDVLNLMLSLGNTERETSIPKAFGVA